MLEYFFNFITRIFERILYPQNVDKFSVTVEELRRDLGSDAVLDDLLARLKKEAADFGIARSGDPAPALRLLAFDGILTEMLAK